MAKRRRTITKAKRPKFNLAERLETLRKSSVNFVAVASLIFAVVILAKAAGQRATVIQLINVPQPLLDRGYTREVIAQRLTDEVVRLFGEAKTLRSLDSFATVPFHESLPKIEIAGSGISMSAIANSLKEMLGWADNKILGDLTIDGSTGSVPKYRLQLRADHSSQVYRTPNPSDDLDSLWRDAARSVLEWSNPYVAGVLYVRDGKLSEAARMAQLCIRSHGKREHRSWCYNLRGSIAIEQKRYDDAEGEYQAASKDRRFTLAAYNIGHVHYLKKNYQKSALLSLKGVMKDPDLQRRALGFTNAGASLRQMAVQKIPYRQDQDGARLIDALRSVLEKPNDLPIFENGRPPPLEAAIAMFKRAIDADATYSSAFYQWAGLEVARHRDEEAEKLYQLALATDHASFSKRTKANIHHNLGRILVRQEQYERAFSRFELAAKEDETYPWLHLRWGEALLAHADNLTGEKRGHARHLATIKFERAAELLRDDGPELLKIGRTFKSLEMPDKAAGIFRVVLTLDEDSAAEATAELERLILASTRDR